jgi:purine-binding chemotaxis protein CheW
MTIQERLSALATTTEEIGGKNLTPEQLEEEKRKNSIIDYKMVTFSLAGKDYAIDIMNIKEIAKAGHFTYVPNSLPFVLGVYNLRGEIIPIIDLRLFFNIEVPEHDENVLENTLIVLVGDQMFGVVVDEIDKVVGIQKNTIQPPHPLFGDINIKYIYGVVEAERHLYVLLDIDKIFGLRTPEEEQSLAESVQAQMEKKQALAAEAAAAAQSAAAAKESAARKKAAEEAALKQAAADFNFISDSLKTAKKFFVSDVTAPWVRKRYEEWKQERGANNTQFSSESDADAFLKPFYSRCNEGFWTEKYANEVSAALPDNSAKNIVVWNPGCGKGFEAYSLACLLKKRYPNAHVRIYAHDIDLLSVSNAPLMTVSEAVSTDWYQPYLTKTVTGDYTFSKEIKDMVMFEYHDCVNTNSLPDIDIIFARDIVSFLPEASQKTMLADFKEKLKGNGVVIAGDNEDISVNGMKKKSVGSITVYTK